MELLLSIAMTIILVTPFILVIGLPTRSNQHFVTGAELLKEKDSRGE